MFLRDIELSTSIHAPVAPPREQQGILHVRQRLAPQFLPGCSLAGAAAALKDESTSLKSKNLPQPYSHLALAKCRGISAKYSDFRFFPLV